MILPKYDMYILVEIHWKIGVFGGDRFVVTLDQSSPGIYLQCTCARAHMIDQQQLMFMSSI